MTEAERINFDRVIAKIADERIIKHIDEGKITRDDILALTKLSDERRSKFLEYIDRPEPNPQEQQEWKSIEPQLRRGDEALLKLLQDYIKRWQEEMPLNNHVAEAKAASARILDSLEENEWQTLNKADSEQLVAFIKRHPATAHKTEIDNCLWATVEENTAGDDQKNLARLYIQTFPDGAHTEQAKALFPAAAIGVTPPPALPAEIKDLDLFALWTWIANNPYHEHYNVACQQVQVLKEKEIETMADQPWAYAGERVLFLMENGIISEEELIAARLATPQSLQILRERDEILETLPDINVEISRCRKECADGHTDVFLFGIPSTGKTCILMGLIGSPNININTVRAGGPYSCVLEQFLEAGLTIGQTPTDFIATIEAEIIDGRNKHLLNLVEMAGEDFAFKIANNENNVVSFEDIGTGATRLLCNDNRKAFFIIVDPTAKRVAFNHLVNETDAAGNTRTFLVRKNVNQKIILKRIIDLMAQPENRNILRNVDSINIIVTKADVLGSGVAREDEAYRRFMEQYKNIVSPLVTLCRENGINQSTNGIPMLYTFSLGRFYVGGVYQYDPTDANKLIEVLKGATGTATGGDFGNNFRPLSV